MATIPPKRRVTFRIESNAMDPELKHLHPTAATLTARLAERGLVVEVSELPASTRTAKDAAAACGCELGQIVKSLVFVVGGETTMVLCAGDRRVEHVDGRTATADEVRAETGFAIGGVPPLGHDRELPTIVDASLRRFDRVWCAAGTPNAVFDIALGDLLAALPGAVIRTV
jgi:prolyl-tRNA editing enzyme YbaK/EbsC (Cys-tRNA(Pro) deacylase)